MRKFETYERFHRHIAAWVDGEIDCLIVLGPPGIGNSHAYKRVLGNRPHHLFGGRLWERESECPRGALPDLC